MGALSRTAGATRNATASASRELLKRRRVAYALPGEELGARPGDPDCYGDSHVQYERLAHTTRLRSGMARVLECDIAFR